MVRHESRSHTYKEPPANVTAHRPDYQTHFIIVWPTLSRYIPERSEVVRLLLGRRSGTLGFNKGSLRRHRLTSFLGGTVTLNVIYLINIANSCFTHFRKTAQNRPHLFVRNCIEFRLMLLARCKA